ncbi:MAG: hypothetical protein ACRERU_05695 [Methylococcales bacterium]
MSNQEDPNKLWGGRFTAATGVFVETFTASVEFDQGGAARVALKRSNGARLAVGEYRPNLDRLANMPIRLAEYCIGY